MPSAWPETLPCQFETSSYGEAEANGLIRSNNDTGPANVRPRSSAAVRPLGGSMVMTGAQRATLKDFVTTTLIGGALPFTFPDPEAGDDILVRFADQGLPAWSRLGSGFWRAALKLEILP